MSEFMETLWPKEEAQPIWEIKLGEETYELRWQNTWIQHYHTGDERYDAGLITYDHVVHKYGEHEDGADYVIITFEQLGEVGMRFLEAHGYPQHTDPIPQTYILSYMAGRATIDIPEAPSLDIGENAA